VHDHYVTQRYSYSSRINV